MPDYQKMYLTLFHAAEEAIDTLIAAQRACEELYLAEDGPEEPASPSRQEAAP